MHLAACLALNPAQGSPISRGVLRISLRLCRTCAGLSLSMLSSDTCTATCLLIPLPRVCFRLVLPYGMSLTRLGLCTYYIACVCVCDLYF